MMNNSKPVMTVFAGTNGAGKSTLSWQMREWIGEVVDPDQNAMRLNPEDPRSADMSAGKEAIKKIQTLIQNNDHFAVETTLSGTFYLRHMRLAKQKGYEITMYYIGLQDVQMHIDRVASRVEQGGHWISEKDIRWRYGQSLQNLQPAIEIADQVILIDNTYEPIIVADIQQNQLIYKIDHVPEWYKSVNDL
ncbi:zeta toxin family protein [Paenibacillus urinalis]|uniref:UDP-N-acetylglucosamine kinase n=2 Tax=Paenibacillus urinalis TaxID=521520 RepID=A0AAX3N2G9_9BACL|nr:MULTISPECIES: zeta toxin family protein [Paenibacillus]WDH82874.1 zeta toxin family protein [Paenibacillus urinalis]WDH98922.1 zeta toxin family protein [Paenibacillus urinalis]WDI02619.1 zeta toxin family protein [Paenibacillus urinalis]